MKHLTLAAFLAGIWSARENYGLKIRHETLTTANANLTICQLSDIHYPINGVTLKSLVHQCRLSNPDLIVITGDMYDDSLKRVDQKLTDFLISLVAIAPVYYVRGNHEVRINQHRKFEQELIKTGIHLLKGEGVLTSGIYLYGVDELNRTKPISLNKDTTNVILAHHPEDSVQLAKNEHIDLILSGHAHGGQIQICGQGLLAPGQGKLPRFTQGMYQITERTWLNLSVGIGFSAFKQRINNRPEIVIIHLKEGNDV